MDADGRGNQTSATAGTHSAHQTILSLVYSNIEVLCVSYHVHCPPGLPLYHLLSVGSWGEASSAYCHYSNKCMGSVGISLGWRVPAKTQHKD